MIKEINYDSELTSQNIQVFDVFEEEHSLEDDLVDTLTSTDKLFLCANEIGYNKRAFCIRFGDEIKTFLNPAFQNKEDYKLVREICPKDNKEYIIPRASKLTLCYQDWLGKNYCNVFSDDSAFVINNALDHLDGLYTCDYGLEILPEFDQATDEERQEVIQEYIESLSTLFNNLDQELRNDEDTKKEWDLYRFAKLKSEGKIDFVENNVDKLNRAQRRFLIKSANKKTKELNKKEKKKC